MSDDARWDFKELKNSYRAQPERPLQNSGQLTCHLLVWGLGTREKELNLCAPYRCWKDFCAESVLLALHRWRGTTALELHFTRATRLAQRERESFTCCRQLESNFSKSCWEREGMGGCLLLLLTGCMVTFRGGGGNRLLLSGKLQHGGWNDFKWDAMDRAAEALLGPNHFLGQQR